MGATLDLPCPSGILWFCLSVIIQLKLEYLWGQLANVDQILYEASLGWGKGCIRFWDRLDQNCGFHGNRKRPLTYSGEKDVSTFSLLFFYQIFFKLAGNEDRHKISDEFEFRSDQIGGPWGRIKFSIDNMEFSIFNMESPSSLNLSNIRIFRHTFLGNFDAVGRHKGIWLSETSVTRFWSSSYGTLVDLQDEKW